MAAVLATAPQPATAQSSTRPSASPVAPADTAKPSFNTVKPQYEGADPFSKARDTVVAEVEGRAITLSQIRDRIVGLPSNITALPFEVLFPAMVDQLILREALVARARRLGFDEDPAIRRRMSEASDEILANEAVTKEIGAKITEPQLLERYRRDYAGKPGPEEVRVRVILVYTEAEATAVINRLRAGEDFAAVAKAVSKDVSASTGGDLGFLARDGLNAEIGAVAFVLPPGQFSAYPVRGPTGWFVVKTDARRVQPTPLFATVRAEIREALLREGVRTLSAAAMADVIVHHYGMNGKMEGGSVTTGQ